MVYSCTLCTCSTHLHANKSCHDRINEFFASNPSSFVHDDSDDMMTHSIDAASSDDDAHHVAIALTDYGVFDEVCVSVFRFIFRFQYIWAYKRHVVLCTSLTLITDGCCNERSWLVHPKSTKAGTCWRGHEDQCHSFCHGDSACSWRRWDIRHMLSLFVCPINHDGKVSLLSSVIWDRR